MSTFNPTPAELSLTSEVFNVGDPQKLGIVTGDTAVKVLSGANLSHVVLGEIWAIADKENNGFLTRKGIAIALRLIGHAQKGEPVTAALLDKPGPLAHIEGISKPTHAGSPAPSSPAPRSPPLKQSSTLPPLTQQDKTKFLRLFIGCGPVNGLLSGDKARDVFVKSKLPFEKLSHIWTLADTKDRGSLDSTDFTIGMYLIQACMSSPSLTLPPALPSWIYEQAIQNLDANMPVSSHTTGGSGSALGSPLQNSFQIPRQLTGSGTIALGPNTIQPQYTGQQPSQPPPRQTPTFPNAVAPPPPAPFHRTSTQVKPWDVTAEAKANADQFFDTLDPQRRGYIEGDVAVPFMLQSKLPEGDLAQIWDLADLRSDGRLTREGFAVAMHLINSKLAGNEIPATLPSSLIPPAMRQSEIPTPETFNEPQLDLLGDDTPPSSAVQPQATNGSANAQIQPSIAPNAPVSSHSTGQGAFHAPSQSAFQSFPSSRQSSASVLVMRKDLLSDDDDDHSSAAPVPDNSAEIGNLQNQIASTTRSLSGTQAERNTTEQTVTQQASQLSQLQTQLSSAKASYETEARLLATLRERMTAQRVDIQKTQEELIRAESDLSATKVEKAEVEGNVLRDKEEIRGLQRRMKEVGDETEALKVAIEKTKKDARQQKGLLAIAKKQLATAEAEKIKVSKELEVAQKELEVVQQEKEDVDAHVASLEASVSSTARVDQNTSPAPSTFAAGVPLPDTPHSTTPQPTASRQSTNPFERLAMASGGPSSPSPFRALSPPNDMIMPTAATPSDPFGFSQPASDPPMPAATSSTNPEDTVGTPKPTATALADGGSDPQSPVSALSPSDNEAPFLTPPSTANPLDPESAKLGAATKQETLFPGAFPSDTHDDDQLRPLQEVNNDTDTSDSDDEPLGVKVATAKKTEDSGSGKSALPPAAATLQMDLGSSPSSPKTTFDDSFGANGGSIASPSVSKVSPPTSGKSSPRRSRSPGRALSTRTLSSHSIAGAMDPFGASTFSKTPLEPPAGEAAPPPTIETVLEPNVGSANASNINDFDEALGKMPTSTKDASSAFKFDSMFDDNFDFSSAINGNGSAPVSPPEEKDAFGTPGSNVGASNSFFPPVSATLTPAIPSVSNSPGPVPAPVGTISFEEAFTPHPAAASANGDPSVSFDDAFGLNPVASPNANGQQSASNGTSLPLGSVPSGTSESPAVISQESPFPALPASPTVPARSQPSPPPRTASPIRPVSPRQPRISAGTSRKSPSPPPRASSPRIRIPSGSKGSSSEKEAPPKHKLSIRFPFGRKDKSKDKEKEDKRTHSQGHLQLPDQQQFLSPVPEPSMPGTATPAVEDDAEPVKQLAAMGFSRTQSIAALETHGYDMQKALNSLLGAA